MESTRKVIVGKIPLRRSSFSANEVLIAVNNGKISDIIRIDGKLALQREDNTEWYFVDEGEYQYDISYSGGEIAFNFSFSSRVAFPTILISNKSVLGKDMGKVILDWASSTDISNIITEFLASNSVTSEKQLFEGGFCEQLENRIRISCREHFIGNWGMFLESVSIKKKLLVRPTNKEKYNKYKYIV